ncbi:hypothetical protein [Actinophytocola glycyrrhizae]|uniref:Uncharacterized protein n=1 Tax=Actinophytocola glycyrrhizae TaxID=2044873 RepID=A0ABV9S2T6_9PSEU
MTGPVQTGLAGEDDLDDREEAGAGSAAMSILTRTGGFGDLRDQRYQHRAAEGPVDESR